MTALRLVGLTVLGWITVAVVFVAALAWMATAVETAGPDAAWVAALQLPGLITPIVPILCALGAGMAAARMDARGERVALAGAGYGPWRTGLGALGAGLLVGMLAYGVQSELVPRAQTVLESGAARSQQGWLWLDDRAVRVSDGLTVHVDAGVITDVRVEPLPDARARTIARVAQHPSTASRADLAGLDLPATRLERHLRLARVLSAGLLALLAWLPLARRPALHMGVTLSLAFTWQVAELAHQMAAAQGAISPLLGAWLPTAALALLLVSRACYSTCR